jgi:hypothetical protein
MISKRVAEYQSSADTEHCRDCVMLRKPRACTLIIGVINLEGHCKYWEAKKSPGC